MIWVQSTTTLGESTQERERERKKERKKERKRERERERERGGGVLHPGAQSLTLSNTFLAKVVSL